MAYSDPAQLLQRIPELESLATDPKIRRAIETGDPFKVYRALVWAKWSRRLPAQQAVLKALVRQRRLFAKSISGAPALGTLNSVGFGFVGKSESDADGTYIALHAFVVLYLFPVIPLQSYLVQKTSSSGLSSQWRIFARVPSSLPGWLYARALALSLVVMVGWGAASSYHKAQTQDVTVVNGFEVPVDVILDGKKQTIAPQGRAVINVKAGDVEGKAAAKQGVLLDSLKQHIASQGGYSIWNIAGAAPVFQENVTYYKIKPTTPSETAGTVYCGRRYVEIAKVDDAFSDPPSSVSMSKHQDSLTRVHLDVAKTPGQSGIASCSYYVLSHDQAEQGAAFLGAAAELGGWESQATGLAMYAAGKKSVAESIRIARRALGARPNDVALHRIYQSVQDDAGQGEQLQQEYAEQARSHPDSASAQYLHAVLLHGTDGLSGLEKVAATFDKNPNILRSLTWRRMVHGDFAGANKSWAVLQQLSPKDAEEVMDAQVQALVAQKRLREALSVLTASLQDPQNSYRPARAAELAMVVRLAGGDPARALDELNKGATDRTLLDYIRVRAGLEPIAARDKQTALVKLSLALRDNPSEALRIAPQLAHVEYSSLGPEQWALLYGEAIRSGNDALVKKLGHFVSLTSHADRDIFQRFVRGEAVLLDQADLEPGVRPAALLVRSRNAALPEKERAELRAKATQTDLMHSVVTEAASKWPA